MSNEEKEHRSEAERVLAQIQEQIDKRQYLNAAHDAATLTGILLSALSCVLKQP